VLSIIRNPLDWRSEREGETGFLKAKGSQDLDERTQKKRWE